MALLLSLSPPQRLHRSHLDSKHSLEALHPPQQIRSRHQRSCNRRQQLQQLQKILSQDFSEAQLPQQPPD